MASASFGDGNRGFQAHTIHGPVHAEFHPPPDRPETPPRPSAAIPFPRDADFVERGTILDEVHRRCAVTGSWAALVGLGGVGKSQLAIEYAYQTRERSDETWVLWVHASNVARFEQSYRDIADRVKVSGRQDPKANIFKLVHDWLCNSKDRWLLVLDNVDDARFLVNVPIAQRNEAASSGSAPKPLRSYIPHSERGSVLITTRNQDAALQLVGRRECITVEPMNDVQASALFKKKLDEDEDPLSIDELAAALEYMPLAIVQAAAYIAQRAPRCSVRQYLDEFRRSERKRTSLLVRDEAQLRRDWEAKNSILVTWQISFEHIRQTRPSAADLLSLISFFDRQGIPADLLRGRAAQTDAHGQQGQEANDPESGEESDTTSESGEGDNGFEDDVVTLRNFCFISVEADGTTFEMHALVQLATRKWLDVNSQLGQWRRAFATLMAREFPSGSFENRTRCQMLLPHVAPMFEKTPTERELLWDWTQVLSNVGWYLWTMGKYREAESVAKKAVETREVISGQDAVLTLHSVGILALVLQYQGKYEAAEAMNRRALEGREKALGNEHPDTLTSVSNLALVLQSQGKYEVAEAMNRRALEGREKALGNEHPDTLVAAGNLSTLLRIIGKFEEAETMIVRVLQEHEKALGNEHPDTLTSVGNLALVLQSQGKYEAAEAMNRRALEGREKALGNEHPDTLTSVSNLAGVLRSQGKYEAAEAMNRRALEGREKALGNEHPSTLTSVSNLALVLQYQGKYEAAEAMNRRALEGYEKALGNEHPDTLTSVSNLALVLQYQGKYEAAEAMNRRALEGREKALGNEHPDTLTSVSNLAGVLRSQGKYEAAEAMNRRALEGSEKALGNEHPDTLTSVYCLAFLLHRWGRYEEAILFYKRASSGYTTTLGPDHPTTQACLDHQISLEQLLHRHRTGISNHGSTNEPRHEAQDDSTHPPYPGPLEVRLPRAESLRKERWWRKFKKKVHKA